MTDVNRDDRLSSAFTEFLELSEQGVVEIEPFLARHGDIVVELRELINMHRPTRVFDETMSVRDTFIPKAIAHFQVLRLIGHGGMGTVFEARDTHTNRNVAVKLLRGREFASPGEVERFRREAEIAANLAHSGIVPLYEFGEHEGKHYIAMALVDGTSLRELIAEGPIAPRRASQIIGQAARAIEHAHSHGVIHRDLKAENVLLDSEDEVKVTDFGLAKQIDDDHRLTHTGQVLGTLPYLAPEQVRGEGSLDPRSDIYSLGATLYELLTGKPPFDGESIGDLTASILNETPIRPQKLNRDVPGDLEAICLRCLQKDPMNRFQTAGQLAEDLERSARGERLRHTFHIGESKLDRRVVVNLVVTVGLLAVVWFKANPPKFFRSQSQEKERVTQSPRNKAVDEPRESRNGNEWGKKDRGENGQGYTEDVNGPDHTITPLYTPSLDDSAKKQADLAEKQAERTKNQAAHDAWLTSQTQVSTEKLAPWTSPADFLVKLAEKIETPVDQLDAFLRIAKAEFAAGNREQGLLHANRVQQLAADHAGKPITYVPLAYMLLAAGEIEEALVVFDTGTKMDKKLKSSLWDVGDLEYQLVVFETTSHYISSDIHQVNTDFQRDVALRFLEIGDISSAAKHLKRTEDAAAVFVRNAQASNSERSFILACDALSRVAILSSQVSGESVARADVLVRQKKAIELIHEAHTWPAREAGIEYLVTLAILLRHAGDPDACQSSMESARELAKDDLRRGQDIMEHIESVEQLSKRIAVARSYVENAQPTQATKTLNSVADTLDEQFFGPIELHFDSELDRLRAKIARPEPGSIANRAALQEYVDIAVQKVKGGSINEGTQALKNLELITDDVPGLCLIGDGFRRVGNRQAAIVCLEKAESLAKVTVFNERGGSPEKATGQPKDVDSADVDSADVDSADVDSADVDSADVDSPDVGGDIVGLFRISIGYAALGEGDKAVELQRLATEVVSKMAQLKNEDAIIGSYMALYKLGLEMPDSLSPSDDSNFAAEPANEPPSYCWLESPDGRYASEDDRHRALAARSRQAGSFREAIAHASQIRYRDARRAVLFSIAYRMATELPTRSDAQRNNVTQTIRRLRTTFDDDQTKNAEAIAESFFRRRQVEKKEDEKPPWLDRSGRMREILRRAGL